MTNNHVRRLSSLLLIAFCLLWAPDSLAAATESPPLRFTILHTNDLHAHDEPYIDRGRTIGGMARIAHVMRWIRSSNPAVVTIDAGDIFQGTPYFKFYHGQIEVELLNDAGYDIYTIGNHEFDDGPINLAEQLKRAKFSIINCNLDTKACPELGAVIKPSVVKVINGQKVAFVGAITPELQKVTLRSDGVKVINADGDWIAPVRDEVASLKKQGIDKIVLVTHVGVELDRKLAQLPDVDVIVGGHSHTRLDKPIVVHHADGSDCIIVQTGSYGRAIGKLDLAFTAGGKVELDRTRYRLINITDKIHSDSDIAAYLAQQSKPFQYMRTEILGTATKDFDNGFRKKPKDSPLGDLIVDALAEGTAKDGVTITLHNRGGIRSRIEKGPINQEKVEELLPFDNSLIIATVSGLDLMKVLENSVGGTGSQNIMLGGRFLEVHGLKFQWNPTYVPHHRVSNIQVLDKAGAFTALDPNADYKIAVNSYTFGGGEDYDFSKAKDVIDTKTKLSNYLHDYLVKHKVVSPKEFGRIIPTAPIPTFSQAAAK